MASKKGVIGLSMSGNLIDFEFKSVVLEEKLHLSHPLILENENNIFLIPETSQKMNSILYISSKIIFLNGNILKLF